METTQVSLNKLSRKFEIPKATLKDLINKDDIRIVGFLGDLQLELETQLCEHILEMESCVFELTQLRSQHYNQKKEIQLNIYLIKKNKLSVRYSIINSFNF